MNDVIEGDYNHLAQCAIGLQWSSHDNHIKTIAAKIYDLTKQPYRAL